MGPPGPRQPRREQSRYVRIQESEERRRRASHAAKVSGRTGNPYEKKLGLSQLWRRKAGAACRLHWGGWDANDRYECAEARPLTSLLLFSQSFSPTTSPAVAAQTLLNTISGRCIRQVMARCRRCTSPASII